MRFISRINSNDYQYIFVFIVCLTIFIASDIFEILNKINFAYWSGGILTQPYRIISAHFFHDDLNHLLANMSGIVVARYCLINLKLTNRIFFVFISALIIPLQSFFMFIFDVFLAKNLSSMSLGFSGVIFGVLGFLLLSSKYGKDYCLFLKIELKRNKQIQEILLTIIILGIVWSFLPGISALGHLAGLISGMILFLI
tara:strand:+ start:377 stop:970 length:594 start_codon:yes stop_codon:yes gene_type:complete